MRSKQGAILYRPTYMLAQIMSKFIKSNFSPVRCVIVLGQYSYQIVATLIFKLSKSVQLGYSFSKVI